MRKSISVSFFSAIITLLLCGILVMGISQTVLFARYYAEEKYATEDKLLTLAMNLNEQGQTEAPDAEKLRQNAERIALIGESSDMQMMYIDAQGSVTGFEGTANLTGSPVSADMLQKLQESLETADTYHGLTDLGGALAHRCYVAAAPIRDGYLFVFAPPASFTRFAGEMFSNFLLSASLMLLCAALLTTLLMSRLVEPLHKISDAAQKFGGGDMTVRVTGIEGDDEVGRLAANFNTMAANLESKDNSRSAFVGNISHELRTPMTTIKGFVDGILDGTIPPEMQQHYLEIVSQEVGRLARLVQNMLDISKMESGEYDANPRLFNIRDTMIHVALSAEQRITEGGIEIEGLDEEEPALVYADPDLIHQVVYNLLDNAIKFTPSGGVIRFSAVRLGPEMEISVWNSGQGISEDALPFVFERFYKEDRSRGLHARGTGLGLYICKVLVNISGGKIRVESRQGEWCRFVFTLPAEMPDRDSLLKIPDSVPDPNAPAAKKGIRIPAAQQTTKKNGQNPARKPKVRKKHKK